MRRYSVLAVVALLTVTPLAQAFPVFLNEIFASHSGTDTLEFIELIGTPGMSLNDVCTLVVEGDGVAAGTLDRVNCMGAAHSMPGDGYWVIGNPGVANLDFPSGLMQDWLENGTETFYLVSTTNAAGLAALVNMDLDTNDDNLIFSAGGEQAALVTILDIIAMVDTGYPGTDKVYDGAAIRGPDGSNFPAGIFRTGDYPSDWDATFLNFDPANDVGNFDTPGAMNVPEPTTLALLALGGLVLIRRR